MPETDKNKETRIKAWLKAHGHKDVDGNKMDTKDDLLKSICKLHGVDAGKFKRILAGGKG